MLAGWMAACGLSGQVDRNSAEHGQFYGNPFLEKTDPTGLGEEPDERLMRPKLFDEIFDTILPGQYGEGDWSLRLNPKMGDFFNDEYVRLLLGVRYSFSNYFDATTEIGSYFGNPFSGGDDPGLYTWRLGARYTWYGVGGTRINVAAGLNADLPIDNPPYELSDGYARYEPFITASYRFQKLPHWLFYLNTTYQVVADAPLRSASPYIEPADRVFIRPGAIYYPGGHFRYSLELEYSTNVLGFRDPPPGGTEPPEFERTSWILAHTEVHELYAYPGVTWFPSRKVREGMIIPGNWDISLRARIPVFEETDSNFSLSLRIRWYYDYRRLFRGPFRGMPLWPGE